MGEQIRSYFAAGIGRITAFLPDLVAAIIVLAIGWAVSWALGGITRRVLAGLHFDRWMAERVHPRAGARSSSATVGSIVFWLGMLTTFSLAARDLHLYALSSGINRILAYLPHVFVAAIILVVGIAVGNFVLRLLDGVAHPSVAKAAQVAIIVLAVFMAIDQLGVARDIVMTIFSLALGAAAVAAAIAFGVGNRQLAGEYTRRWAKKIDENIRRPQEPELPMQH